jgi:hypothetical protein
MKFLTHLLIWLFIAISAPLAVSQRSSYDPAAENRNDSHQGFTDFVLKQINPQNTDYGSEIEEARKLVVAETVKNIDFWTIVVALGFLVLSFFMLVIQHRTRNRLELVAARFLAQYHNSLVDAHKQAERAIRRHNDLVSATDRVVESVRAGHSPDPQAALFGSDPIYAVQPRSSITTAVKTTVSRNQAGPSEPLTSKPMPRPDEAPEADLTARIKSLQQQLAASHAREKNLKRELDKVQRRGQAEAAAKT